jgi:hypothetical protein
MPVNIFEMLPEFGKMNFETACSIETFEQTAVVILLLTKFLMSLSDCFKHKLNIKIKL